MSSIYEEMSSEQKKRAKKIMGQLTQNPFTKSSGAGALSPEAAEELGDKAKELRKKKLAKVGLPSINKNPFSKEMKSEREMTSGEIKKEKKLLCIKKLREILKQRQQALLRYHFS